MSLQNRGVARATGVAALSVALLHAVRVVTGSLVSLPGSDASPSAVLRFSTAQRDGVLAVAVVVSGIAWYALVLAVFVGPRALASPEGRIVATVALAAPRARAALIGVVLLFGGLGAYAGPNRVMAVARSGAFLPSGTAVPAAPAFAIWMAMIGAVLPRRPAPLSVPTPVIA